MWQTILELIIHWGFRFHVNLLQILPHTSGLVPVIQLQNSVPSLLFGNEILECVWDFRNFQKCLSPKLFCYTVDHVTRVSTFVSFCWYSETWHLDNPQCLYNLTMFSVYFIKYLDNQKQPHLSNARLCNGYVHMWLLYILHFVIVTFLY